MKTAIRGPQGLRQAPSGCAPLLEAHTSKVAAPTQGLHHNAKAVNRPPCHPRPGSNALVAAALGRQSVKSTYQQGVSSAEAAAAVEQRRLASRASAVVRAYYDAINARDLPAAFALFAESVAYNNLAIGEAPPAGRPAVSRFFAENLSSVPRDARFVIDELTDGDVTRVGVLWRLDFAGGLSIPITRGVSFFRVNGQGLITSVVDSPEYAVKLSAPALSLASPLVQSLAPLLRPAAPDDAPVGGAAASRPAAAGVSNSSSNSGGGAGSGSGEWGWLSDNLLSRLLSGGAAEAAAPAGGQASNQPAPPAAVPVVAAAADSPASSSLGSLGGSLGSYEEESASGAGAASFGGQQSENQSQSYTEPPADVNLSGLWERDASRSDTAGYERTLDVLQLSGLQKVTARLIDGIDIVQSESHYSVNFVTIVPFFRVTEKVPFAGSAKIMRRDLRFGSATASASRVPGGVLVEMSWPQPCAGTLTERYSLAADGQTLTVVSSVNVGDQSSTATLVYTRSAKRKEDLLKSSAQRNGSMQEVLKRQEQQFGKI